MVAPLSLRPGMWPDPVRGPRYRVRARFSSLRAAEPCLEHVKLGVGDRNTVGPVVGNGPKSRHHARLPILCAATRHDCPAGKAGGTRRKIPGELCAALGRGRGDDDAPGGSLGAIANAQRGIGASLRLGPLSELRPRLPLLVELDGEPFRILELEGESSSLIRQSARIGSGRSTRLPRRTACCAAHGTAISSICGPVPALTGAAAGWRRRRVSSSIR